MNADGTLLLWGKVSDWRAFSRLFARKCLPILVFALRERLKLAGPFVVGLLNHYESQ